MNGLLTKNDYAYAEIRDRILVGELPAGEKIPQGQLAQELGLSTTPLREAIRRLVAEGLVVLEAHRDARVARLTAEEARHLYEVREQLDPLAAQLAAERRNDADIARISKALKGLSPLQAVGDLEGLRAHREFHRAIYEASANPILVETLERLWDKADRYRVVGLADRKDSPEDSERVAREHRDIADAVIQGDGRRAKALMDAHIAGSLGRRAISALEK